MRICISATSLRLCVALMNSTSMYEVLRRTAMGG
ncbi:MAG: hypothetical protein ACI9XZ_002325 [Alphaproteobacteria bacterium]